LDDFEDEMKTMQTAADAVKEIMHGSVAEGMPPAKVAEGVPPPSPTK
jgi:hypothetical protein